MSFPVWALIFRRLVLTAGMLAGVVTFWGGEVSASDVNLHDIAAVARSSRENKLNEAVFKWPTMESCVSAGASGKLEPRWAAFQTRADLWVCFYRILSSMKSANEIRQWLARFDIELVESRRNDGQNVFLFSCKKTNKKCGLDWRSIDIVFPILLAPHSFSFTFYERGGIITEFYVSANRE